MKNYSRFAKSAVIASTLIAAGAALAQDRGPMGAGMGPHMHRPPVDIAKLLNLDATRTEKVNAILADEHAARKALWEANKGAAGDEATKLAMRDKMKALRDDTRAKLTAVLTADELQKLRESLPHPAGMRGPHGEGGAKAG
jgi:hypothetical protein